LWTNLQSDDPTNSVAALKDDGQSTRLKANPTRLSSLKSKLKKVTKNFKYTQHMKTEDTHALRR